MGLSNLTAVLGHLADVAWLPLSLALLSYTLVHVVRVRGWQEVLRADFAAPVRYRALLGAYLMGTATNVVVPAKGGEVVKALAARRATTVALPGLLSSLAVLFLLETAFAALLISWGVVSGRLPGVRSLVMRYDDAGRLLLEHPWLSALVVLAGAALLFLVGRLLWHRLSGRVAGWKADLARGLSVLRDWRVLARRVLPWLGLGWGLELAALAFFMLAFSLPVAVVLVLAVQAAQALGRVLPALGGVVAAQGLVVLALAGEASVAAAVGFFLGMRLLIALLHVSLGFLAAALALGTIDPRRVREVLRPRQLKSLEPALAPAKPGQES